MSLAHLKLQSIAQNSNFTLKMMSISFMYCPQNMKYSQFGDPLTIRFFRGYIMSKKTAALEE